jgi:hypothetical protein
MSNFSMPGLGNANVRVDMFLLTQTGTYQEQQLRPFQVHVNESVIENLARATRGGANLGVSAVQSLAGEIVKPSAMTEGAVGIANGWNSRRFRGMLRVREEHPIYKGTTTQRIFFVYTDQCDASMNYLDPNMRIYFNSETVITEAMKHTPMGMQKHAQIVSSNQIVTPLDMNAGANGYYSTAASHLVRPEDVFSIGQTLQTVNRLQQSGAFPGTVNRAYDYRTMVGECGAYQYSHRQDTSPTRYVSNSLNAFQHSVKEAAMAAEGFDDTASNMELLLGEAQAHVQNDDIHKNTFLAILKERCGYMERGFITLSDLNREFPDTLRYGEVTKYSMDNGQSIRKVNYAEQSCHFKGADPTSIAASMLAQTIPSIMMDNYLRLVTIAVTNGNMPGTYAFQISGEGTKLVMEGIDARPYLLEFERRLGTDCLNALTHNNGIPFQISLTSDLAGDSVIDISLGGEAPTRFVAPTFSDGLFSPVITRDGAKANKISTDMIWLVQNVIPNNFNSGSNTTVQGGSLSSAAPQQHNQYMVQPYQHPVASAAPYNPQYAQGDVNAIPFEGL